MMPPEIIPTGIARCCRDWTVALGHPWGSCGVCGERPAYVEMLPEDQWVTPRPPIDQRTKREDGAA